MNNTVAKSSNSWFRKWYGMLSFDENYNNTNKLLNRHFSLFGDFPSCISRKVFIEIYYTISFSEPTFRALSSGATHFSISAT